MSILLEMHTHLPCVSLADAAHQQTNKYTQIQTETTF